MRVAGAGAQGRADRGPEAEDGLCVSQELALKDAQIADLKQKMEDMALEFGEMLKETLVRPRCSTRPSRAFSPSFSPA